MVHDGPTWTNISAASAHSEPVTTWLAVWALCEPEEGTIRPWRYETIQNLLLLESPINCHEVGCFCLIGLCTPGHNAWSNFSMPFRFSDAPMRKHVEASMPCHLATPRNRRCPKVRSRQTGRGFWRLGFTTVWSKRWNGIRFWRWFHLCVPKCFMYIVHSLRCICSIHQAISGKSRLVWQANLGKYIKHSMGEICL